MSQEGGTNFSLISLGKPIEKLIDSVSKAVGTIYKPRSIRNEADAQAYKIETIANATAKSSIIKSEAENEIADRARQRLYHQEMQRQVNIDNVVENSIKYLHPTAPDQPVDEDWFTRFFIKVQDIKNEEVSEIWAKILANEINNPGQFSVRAIDVLSNLSKNEAEHFKILLSIKFENGNDISVLKTLKNDLKEFGLSFDDLLNLDNAGLIYSDFNLDTYGNTVTLEQNGNEVSGWQFRFGGKVQFLPDVTSVLKKYGMNGFPAIPFTRVGEELARVVKVEPNYEYWEQFKADWTNRGLAFIEI
ncbi:MAG TPA: DUF2806 domain-containing protein [Mucilaginibacter sp.]|jgi:hypothetical protein|nr:DUF2806 domain-containing protein [Mucilaginibacter sp.]